MAPIAENETNPSSSHPQSAAKKDRVDYPLEEGNRPVRKVYLSNSNSIPSSSRSSIGEEGGDHQLEQVTGQVGMAPAAENETNPSRSHPQSGAEEDRVDHPLEEGNRPVRKVYLSNSESIPSSSRSSIGEERGDHQLEQRLMWFHLWRHGAPRGRCPNEHKVPVGGPKEVIRSPDEDTKPYINTMSVVAALIATLTFAAAFTMPGGYDSSPDNLGGATLVKKAALKAFILSDTLAMCCSITVVSLLWRAMRVEQDLKFVLTNASVILLHIALLATLVAFMSGIFAVIAPKALWIAILVCIVCTMVFCLLTPERVQRSSLSTWFTPNIITRDILRFIQLKQGRNKRKRDQHNVESRIQKRSPDTNCVSNTTNVNEGSMNEGAEGLAVGVAMESFSGSYPACIVEAMGFRLALQMAIDWNFSQVMVEDDVVKPTKGDTETQPKYDERLDDWDRKNHLIITWCRNTSFTSINLQFGRFQNVDGPAKAIWDFLKERSSTTGLAHQYQLLSLLHRMHQEPGQSIDKFLSQAISELFSEETRLGTTKSQSLDAVLATHQTRICSSAPNPNVCRHCHSPDHQLFYCLVRICKHCLKPRKGHYQEDCYKNPNRRATGNFGSKGGQYKSGNRAKHTIASRTAAATAKGSSSTIPFPPDTYPPVSKSDIEAIVRQVLLNFGMPPSTALSMTSGSSSWFFDSACCNHMTFDSTIFSSNSSSANTHVVHTADGSHMHVSHVGSIVTTNATLSDTYLILTLTLSLISVGQLCDLGLTITFSRAGYQFHLHSPNLTSSFTDSSVELFPDDELDIGSSLELLPMATSEMTLMPDDPAPHLPAPLPLSLLPHFLLRMVPLHHHVVLLDVIIDQRQFDIAQHRASWLVAFKSGMFAVVAPKAIWVAV
ncbi:hypothetical protein Vadar_000297 [Vaccinium darrowii]|uniref:Uncharacterized protein n=1 Tax=Vaccinium darrowii TaxID=229202 RepID=A0ACB7XM20_9ERIC|nr:hypothetical protein Vadar_000297 [Vaccinium darrowii]